jgi:hypothetical protein
LPSVFALVAGLPVTTTVGGEEAAPAGKRTYQRPAVVETVKVYCEAAPTPSRRARCLRNVHGLEDTDRQGHVGELDGAVGEERRGPGLVSDRVRVIDRGDAFDCHRPRRDGRLRAT